MMVVIKGKQAEMVEEICDWYLKGKQADMVEDAINIIYCSLYFSRFYF